MSNWYKKIARRGTDRSLMDEYSDPFGDKENSEPKTLTKWEPFPGSNRRTTDQGENYPKGTSAFESDDEEPDYKTRLPHGDTILDDLDDDSMGDKLDSTYQDERFTSTEDKKPIGGISERLDKGRTGPHNMSGQGQSNIFDFVKNRTKPGINRV